MNGYEILKEIKKNPETKDIPVIFISAEEEKENVLKALKKGAQGYLLKPVNPEEIKKNLKLQLTAPVKWTQTVKNMLADGASSFTEVGPGSVLQGLIRKVDRKVEAKSA
jgi:CheY-like chemotaxis protein